MTLCSLNHVQPCRCRSKHATGLEVQEDCFLAVTSASVTCTIAQLP